MSESQSTPPPNLELDPLIIKANQAFTEFTNRYLHDPLNDAKTNQDRMVVTDRVYSIVKSYQELTISAASEGVTLTERPLYILHGMIEKGLIDGSDPVRADKEYKIISDGYELNRGYWEPWLEKIRAAKRDIENASDSIEW